MNEISFYSKMSIPVAAQRGSRREQLRLVSPGTLRRTLVSLVRRFGERIEARINASTEQEVYCKYHPVECRL